MQACRKAAGALASTSLPAAEALRGALPAVAQRFYHKNVRTVGLVACGTQGQHDCMLRIRHSAAEADNRARECSSIACWCCVRPLHLVQSLRSHTVRSLGRDSGMLLFIQESTKSERQVALFTCLFTALWKGCRWLSCAPAPEAACAQVVDHYDRPRNVGSFDKTDVSVGTGLVGAPACGDVMKLQIKARVLPGAYSCASLCSWEAWSGDF